MVDKAEPVAARVEIFFEREGENYRETENNEAVGKEQIDDKKAKDKVRKQILYTLPKCNGYS